MPNTFTPIDLFPSKKQRWDFCHWLYLYLFSSSLVGKERVWCYKDLYFIPGKALTGFVLWSLLIFLLVSEMGIITPHLWNGDNNTSLVVIFEFTVMYLKSVCSINWTGYHNYSPPFSNDQWQTVEKERFLPLLPIQTQSQLCHLWGLGHIFSADCTWVTTLTHLLPPRNFPGELHGFQMSRILKDSCLKFLRSNEGNLSWKSLPQQWQHTNIRGVRCLDWIQFKTPDTDIQACFLSYDKISIKIIYTLFFSSRYYFLLFLRVPR